MTRQIEWGTAQGFPVTSVYLGASRLAETLVDDRVMAVIGFGATTGVNASDPRQWRIGLPLLAPANTLEVWYSHSPVATATVNGIACHCNSAVLLACLLLHETEFSDLETTIYCAYRRLLACIREQGYPHVLRVWNYFPDINREDGGLERYRAFCQGRHRALVAELADFETRLPAACALGTRTEGVLIYALAAKQPGIQVENPRQTSAFRYPPQYGPKSPSFSRSIAKAWDDTHHQLYISGTASIVGHATQHSQDFLAQVEETLENLTALLENANRCTHAPFRLGLLKVYVRHSESVDPLRTRIAQQFGAVPVLFLQADICRSDLLIEIEGLATSVDG